MNDSKRDKKPSEARAESNATVDRHVIMALC